LAAALPAGTQVGAYTLGAPLGQGGFGITYTTNDAAVAVKEFYPGDIATRGLSGRVVPLPGQSESFTESLSRFAREAQILRALEHPATTGYIAFWQENNTTYLAMERIHGESLEARIAQGEKLSEVRARRAMLEILSLLEVVHAQGLLHRDIKPGNIVLTERRAELIDFGSATSFTRAGVTTRLLTPEYAPLELYGKNVQLSPASDLYSLCATFYEALTLRKPPSAIDRMNGATVIPVRTLEPAVSVEFAQALETGLALRVENRHSSANGLIEALTKLQRVQSTQHASVLTPTRPVQVSVPRSFAALPQAHVQTATVAPSPNPNVVPKLVANVVALAFLVSALFLIWPRSPAPVSSPSVRASTFSQTIQDDANERAKWREERIIGHATKVCREFNQRQAVPSVYWFADVTSGNGETGAVSLMVSLSDRQRLTPLLGGNLDSVRALILSPSFVNRWKTLIVKTFDEPQISTVFLFVRTLESTAQPILWSSVSRQQLPSLKNAAANDAIQRAMNIRGVKP
jgi:serine/threonine protein kinase